jgi:hypothetical protein
MSGVNPIQSVDGVSVLCPASYTYKLSDISDADAGRTEDTTMDKMRIGQAVHLELSWNALTWAEASSVLRAFNPEYITVTYMDALSGTWRTSQFYVGDRSAPMYNAQVGLWSNISFNIIERKGVER